MHRLLTAAEYRTMAWKNGGGRTSEIAVHPAGAALDAFDWRISIADVAASGPFSAFPGVDRTIVLLEGGGMRLEASGRGVEIRNPYEPYAFSGDVAVDCVLLAGPVRDFNLLLRRGRARGGLAVARDAGTRIAPAADRFCHVATGRVACALPGLTVVVGEGETLWLGGEDADAAGTLSVDPLSRGAVALVATIDRCR
jgi:hypothetical protein